MNKYRVVWTIEVQANSFREAGRLAYKIMLDPDSKSTCFDIERLRDSIEEEIDLNNK